MYHKHIEHFQKEFRVNFDISGHFLEQLEDLNQESVPKIKSFLVELILRDLHVFHALINDIFVHDVGDNFVNERSEFLSNRLMIDDWEFVDFIKGE
jgi:GGDEF domain-containing protein